MHCGNCGPRSSSIETGTPTPLDRATRNACETRFGLAVPAFPSHTAGRKIGHSVRRASATKPRSLISILYAMKLLWILQLPVRSFKTPGILSHSCRHSSTKTSNPLRILFCGSDEFSIASLRAIHNEHLRNPKTIASIDVVHRPGKRTGRGLKLIREGMHAEELLSKRKLIQSKSQLKR